MVTVTEPKELLSVKLFSPSRWYVQVLDCPFAPSFKRTVVLPSRSESSIPFSVLFSPPGILFPKPRFRGFPILQSRFDSLSLGFFLLTTLVRTAAVKWQ